MHFNTIRSEKGRRFLEICQKHKDRISLEFGLQTIHDEEMKILRKEKAMYFQTAFLSQYFTYHFLP
jgi:radical SAM superfamily enzyme